MPFLLVKRLLFLLFIIDGFRFVFFCVLDFGCFVLTTGGRFLELIGAPRGLTYLFMLQKIEHLDSEKF